MASNNEDRPRKRPKISPGGPLENVVASPGLVSLEDSNQPHRSGNDSPLASLTRSITPPPQSRSRLKSQSVLKADADANDASLYRKHENNHENGGPRLIPSPIQLTNIRDLPESSGNNVDTVKLRDILGDPMIRECWQFNYLFDVDFLMSQFDEDIRDLVQVKVVHGSWKKDAPNRIRIDEACSRYRNVEAITAYMPEPFGTHHSKMMILLRHDDLAQVVIHTANMIPGDWANMCQAVWRSPLLPLSTSTESTKRSPTVGAIGTGARFKRDLLAYLDAYGNKKTGELVKQLEKYDFSGVRAALIASVPSKQKVSNITDSKRATLWGWPALRDIMRHVPVHRDKKASGRPNRPHIVIQISSIASLGQTDKWLKEVIFESLCPSSSVLSSAATAASRPKYSIIFPTPDEIRRSLNGYGSGGSIHMKLQSAAQQKQLQYMRPYLCQWAGDREDPTTTTSSTSSSPGGSVAGGEGEGRAKREAGRRRAAPHIKTYIRFADAETMDRIDWAMVTSANLSTQAWGAAANASGEVRICSWEIGVVVWPDLFAPENQGEAEASADADANADGERRRKRRIEMVPCFKRDLPSHPPPPPPPTRPSVATATATATSRSDEVAEEEPPSAPSTIVGFRMPYDLPLTPYAADDVPWCATARHTEPDWLGQTWEGE